LGAIFCRPGDVLVIDAGGDLNNAVIGDVAEVRSRDFPVYARGVTHRGPYKDVRARSM